MFIFSFLLNSAAVLGFSRLPPFIKKKIAAHPRSGDGLLEILEGKFEGHPLSLLEETTTLTCLNGATLSEDGACACVGGYSGTDCSTAPSTVLACQNDGVLSADGGSCDCGPSGYSGTSCDIVCSSQGDMDDKGKCKCNRGYFGFACQNSVSERLGKLATYCAQIPSMTALGSAGVMLNQAQSVLLTLCPHPST